MPSKLKEYGGTDEAYNEQLDAFYQEATKKSFDPYFHEGISEAGIKLEKKQDDELAALRKKYSLNEGVVGASSQLKGDKKESYLKEYGALLAKHNDEIHNLMLKEMGETPTEEKRKMLRDLELWL